MDALLSVPLAFRWIVTILFVGFVIGLSITPGIEQPNDNLFSWLYAHTSSPVQKALHVAAYALLGFLWVWSLGSIESVPVRLAVSFLITLGLGVTLEWYQTTIPGRFGTIVDVLLNALGALLGLLAAFLLI